MEDSEATLTQKLLAAMGQLPDAEAFKINDRSTAGIPDCVVTWNGFTTWFEVKYANPKFKRRELQHLTLRRLYRANKQRARYVVYDAVMNKVYIVAPKDLENWRQSVVCCSGFEHAFVVDYIRRTHQER